jgi:hypothetical protein
LFDSQTSPHDWFSFIRNLLHPQILVNYVGGTFCARYVGSVLYWHDGLSLVAFVGASHHSLNPAAKDAGSKEWQPCLCW